MDFEALTRAVQNSLKTGTLPSVSAAVPNVPSVAPALPSVPVVSSVSPSLPAAPKARLGSKLLPAFFMVAVALAIVYLILRQRQQAQKIAKMSAAKQVTREDIDSSVRSFLRDPKNSEFIGKTVITTTPWNAVLPSVSQQAHRLVLESLRTELEEPSEAPETTEAAEEVAVTQEAPETTEAAEEVAVTQEAPQTTEACGEPCRDSNCSGGLCTIVEIDESVPEAAPEVAESTDASSKPPRASHRRTRTSRA